MTTATTSLCERTALALLPQGYWPVAIYPKGAIRQNGTPSPDGKDPIGGVGWGLTRRTPEQLRAEYARYPDAGTGVALGPGRYGDQWLVDLEGDGEGAAESLSRLLGGKDVETPRYLSTRGRHNLFTADGGRLLELLKAAGGRERKGGGTGVWHLDDEFPGLEWRIGGFKPDGTTKQLQSVVPPTVGTDGKPRQWIVSPRTPVAPLPEAAYAFLEDLAERRAIQEAEHDDDRPVRTPSAPARSGTDPVDAYVAKALEDECDAVAAEAEGGRNNRLNAAAFSLGTLIGAHAIDRATVEQALLESARRAGLDHVESALTIRSGIEAGIQQPRNLAEIGTRATGRHGRPRWPASAVVPRDVPPAPDAGAATPNLDTELAKRPHTDLGNAERLAARSGADLRYCHPWSKWLCWDGRRWAIDNTAAVRRRAKQTIRRMLAEAATIEDKGAREALIEWAATSESKPRIDAMLGLATAEEGIPILPAAMDQDGWLFNVANGTIDLRTGTLGPHRREDMLTQLCPVEFDPAARCPLWEDTQRLFLGGDDELIDYWQRVCGYALAGVVRDHLMPIAYGSGSNGKSTILGTLLGVFGPDYAMKCPPDMLMSKKHEGHPTDRTDLFRKRLVVAIETEAGRRLNETLVKELTGGDTIRARRMREDFWEFQPTHTLVMATNHRPVIRGSDNGVWRRLKLVPFLVSVSGKQTDTSMPEKLKAEYPGILAWLVRGCLEWQRRGLEEPSAVRDATAEYRGSQDRIGAFLAENATTDASMRVRAGELYARYKAWGERGNEHVMSNVAFAEAMQERGFEKRASNGMWYLGLGLRPDCDAAF